MSKTWQLFEILQRMITFQALHASNTCNGNYEKIKKHLENALMHLVWHLRLSFAGQGVALDDPYGSLPAQNILILCLQTCTGVSPLLGPHHPGTSL